METLYKLVMKFADRCLCLQSSFILYSKIWKTTVEINLQRPCISGSGTLTGTFQYSWACHLGPPGLKDYIFNSW